MTIQLPSVIEFY